MKHREVGATDMRITLAPKTDLTMHVIEEAGEFFNSEDVRYKMLWCWCLVRLPNIFTYDPKTEKVAEKPSHRTKSACNSYLLRRAGVKPLRARVAVNLAEGFQPLGMHEIKKATKKTFEIGCLEPEGTTKRDISVYPCFQSVVPIGLSVFSNIAISI